MATVDVDDITYRNVQEVTIYGRMGETVVIEVKRLSGKDQHIMRVPNYVKVKVSGNVHLVDSESRVELLGNADIVNGNDVRIVESLRVLENEYRAQGKELGVATEISITGELDRLCVCNKERSIDKDLPIDTVINGDVDSVIMRNKLQVCGRVNQMWA